MRSKITTYSFIPKPNEQIDTVITLEDETRSMLFGIIKDCKGKVVKDAVVKLFKAKDCDERCSLKPITHAFTDECGQFFFGPLEPGKRYVIKVWVNDVKVYNTEEDGVEGWEEDANSYPKDEGCQKNKAPVKDTNNCDKYYYR
ncbi:hypothetical protein [Acetivibrio cellulolyticus]|uniref:hypothetical protein n=1 Tax=Acetivibrio cellulolyticus TaxID=35830 RepID=UPI0001E2DE3D|nr:hypothetical protein [Acetivibrio cellulolyticus]